MSLSSDGSMLLSVSEGTSIHSNTRLYEYIIWNIRSGDMVWNKTLPTFYKVGLSPDGRYLIDFRDHKYGIIKSIPSGEQILNFSGKFYSWSKNSEYFVTANDTHINIWNSSNFSLYKSIPINETIRKISISPNGTKMAVELYNSEKNTLVLIDINSNNVSYLYNYVEYSSFTIHYLTWSKDGKEIQMVKKFRSFNSTDYYQQYRIIIWDATNNNILHNFTVKHKLGEMAMNRLLDVGFKKYIIFDYNHENKDKSKIIFYNITGEQRIFYDDLYQFDLSYNEEVMAISKFGIIKIKNATTGKLINTIRTPEYEIERPIPGFEIIAFIGAIILILIIYKRK